jgi:crossover junction endodeoxyribonuclease RuvC
MSLVIGIDPGLTGAIALLSPAGELERLADLQSIRDKALSWIHGGYLQSFLIDACRGRSARAVVERVSAMPGQGVSSAFTFGMGLGSILAVLQARLLYPAADLQLKKHHGRAEALLLAHWALTRTVGAAA